MGDVLGMINSIDTIYQRCKSLWGRYETMRGFGRDYQDLIQELVNEQLNFDFAVLYFLEKLQRSSVTPRIPDRDARELIGHHMARILEAFEMCYKLAAAYRVHNESSGMAWLKLVEAAVETLDRKESTGNHTSTTSLPAQLGLTKKQRMSETISKYFKRRQMRSANGKAPGTTYSTTIGTQALRTQSRQDRGVLLDPFQSNRRDYREPYDSRTWPRESIDLSADSHVFQARQERSWRISRSHQASALTKVSWANFGKEKFGDILATIHKMNERLYQLLPNLQFEDPILFLRRGCDTPPTILDETRSFRKGLHQMHRAIQGVNKPANGTNARFAVKLEGSDEELVRTMERWGLLAGLKLTGDPVICSMMGAVGGGTALVANSADFIVTGTVWESFERKNISNITVRMKDLEARRDQSDDEASLFQEIGDIRTGSGEPVCHLRRVTGPETRIKQEQSLRDVVGDLRKLPRKERVELAAKIALSHIHFDSVDLGPAPRQLNNYRLYRQEFESPDAVDWATQPRSYLEPWLDHNFGVPVAPQKRGPLKSRAAIEQDMVNPIHELGVLLHQITNAEALGALRSQQELADACKVLKQSPNVARDVCGATVGMIVEVCLSLALTERKYDTTTRLALFQEITYALQRCMATLKDRKTYLVALKSGQRKTGSFIVEPA